MTGKRVHVKTAARQAILHEYSMLLAVPRGVSAEPWDLVWDSDGSLALVQERLEGRTLLEAAPTVPSAEIPYLLYQICRCLIPLHRVGIVHGDLKPANLFLLDGEAPVVRLLDFGSARSLASAFGVDGGEGQSRATAPFAAPELLRGWAIDGRADLYSIGVTFRHLFPATERDLRWSGVLGGLCQASPSKRFPDAGALLREVQTAFGLTASPPLPVLGGGLMVGRSREIEEVLAWHRGSSNPSILRVQARPHTGLTRFLRESIAAAARQGGSPLDQIDFSDSEGPMGADDANRAVRFAEDSLRNGHSVLLGIPDPSPGLHWLADPAAGVVRSLIQRHRAAGRMILRPLARGEIRDCVAAVLGMVTPSSDSIDLLSRITEGDHRSLAEGFSRVIAVAGSSQGGTWTVDENRAREVLQEWDLPECIPTFDQVPEGLKTPLQILSRLGSRFALSCARDLLDAFGHSGAVDALVDRGVMVPAENDDARIVTDRLREDARGRPLPCSGAVDRWLNEMLVPDPQDAPRILEAVARARSLGDRDRTQKYLTAGLECALAEHRWSDLLLLLGFFPGEWTAENAIPRAEEMHCILGSVWPAQRVLRMVGGSLHVAGHGAALGILEKATQLGASTSAYESVALLARIDMDAGRLKECESRLTLLEAWGTSHELAPGLLELERGHLAGRQGRKAEALECAARAVARLAGTGHYGEADGLMLLSSLYLPGRVEEAIGILHRALGATPRRTTRAMIHSFLSQVLELKGDPRGCSIQAQAAMDDLLGEEAERFVVRVRCQRAWAWAHMDEIPAAGREADSLLQVALVQQTFGRLVYVLLLAGFLALHQGNSRSAIAHTARAWDVFTNDLPPQPRPAGLRYLVDCLLDLRAWDLVREHGPSMVLPDLPGDTAALLASTRAEALRAQADGAHERARDLMLAQVDGARSYIAAIQVARYLHHLAMIRLDLSSPEEARKAVVEFREALDRFGPVGYGYFRARSLIGLAHAESLCGDRQAAYCSVDEAIAMSRKIGSRGSLASALEVRAELRVF